MSQNIKLHVADDHGSKEQASQSPKPQSTQSGKPTKVLPTVRVAFTKQLDILRAYAAASGGTSRVVALKDVADIVQLATQTLSLANPFFVDIRLVQRTEGVGMTPSNELLEYAHAYRWNPETATHKIAPLLAQTWFWEVLQPRLAFQELTSDQIVTLLAEKSSAGPSYKSQLKMILEFLEAAGMIKEENGQIRAVKSQRSVPSSGPTGSTGYSGGYSGSVASAPPVSQEGSESHSAPPLRSTTVATSFGQRLGVVSFDISVRVDMDDFIGWEPARIRALFEGIAQVISAKGTFEKESVE